MTNLLFPKARHEEPPPPAEDLRSKIEALEARLAVLQAEKEPPAPAESAVEAFHRQQAEHLAAWAAEQERRKAEREADQVRTREAERQLALVRPQIPSADELQALMDSVQRLIVGDSGRSEPVVAHEDEVLIRFSAVSDLLIPIRDGTVQGWPRQVREGLRGLMEAFHGLAHSWGWSPLVTSPEGRLALVERLRREWSDRMDNPILRAAELWCRLYETGDATPPPQFVARQAAEALIKALRPYDLDPRMFRDRPDHPGSGERVEDWHHSATLARAKAPSLGHSAPIMNIPNKDRLSGALRALCDSLPRPEPVTGWIVGGSTVA